MLEVKGGNKSSYPKEGMKYPIETDGKTFWLEDPNKRERSLLDAFLGRRRLRFTTDGKQGLVNNVVSNDGWNTYRFV